MFLGRHNFLEVLGSEIHRATNTFHLNNRPCGHLYENISSVTLGMGRCTVHQRMCPVPKVKEVLLSSLEHITYKYKFTRFEIDLNQDLYVLGFTCKNFTPEHYLRFSTSVSGLFQGKSRGKLVMSMQANSIPFIEGSRHIRRRRPRSSI